MTAIGAGETPPWVHLPLTCPICGEPDLPLHDSTAPNGAPGSLSYIKHCGRAWARGPIHTKENES